MLKFDSPFRTALFVCTHKRPDGHPKPCCADRGGAELRGELKDLVKAQGMEMEVKVFSSGCIGACDQGPVAIQYPTGELMMGIKPEDVPTILDSITDK